MKVLVVGPDRSDPGGVANYYKAVFPRLSDGEIEASYLEIGSTHVGRSALHIIGDQIRVWRMIGSFQPDIVHLNPSLVLKSVFRDGFFLLVARLRRRSVLVFFRGWDLSFERLVCSRLQWFFRITFAKADMFIVLSRRFSDSLRAWGITAPVHIGTTVVDDDMLRGFSIEGKAKSLREAGLLKVLFMARLEHEKGAVILVRSIIQMLDRGRSVELTVAGEGPAMEDINRLLPTGSAYRRHIHVPGYVSGSDKLNLLRSHHIFCLPTQYAEGMPNSLMEAMAFGMPVITCPTGGIADFFVDKVMGRLLTTANPDNICRAIEELSSDRDQSSCIAHHNYEYAIQHFLASTAAEMLRSRYTDIMTAR
jgi:glycosyltransferase involved in cell wall biosynthesis